MLKRQLNREWGQRMARGWASLLLDRLRGFVGSPEVHEYPLPDARHFGPDSAAVHAQWAHTTRHLCTNHNTHGCGAESASAAKENTKNRQRDLLVTISERRSVIVLGAESKRSLNKAVVG